MKFASLFLLPLLGASPVLAGVPGPVAPEQAVVPESSVSRDALTSPANIDAVWRERSPLESPTAATNGAMAFDASAGVVVLFGGYSYKPGYIGETWTWDGSQWEQLHPDASPSGRTNHAMAYDPVREEIVLFGGFDGNRTRWDTWVFHDGNWSGKSPPASPSPRAGHMMAFDPALQQVILFGGGTSSGQSDETWTWDGSTWTELDPAMSPPGRSWGRMAYDPTRERLVMFGGYADGTWTWDGATWTLEKMRRSPPPRESPGMSTFGRHLVLFGGYGGYPIRALPDTWVLKANGWRKLHTELHPRGRYAPAMAWDPVLRQSVVFGGANDNYRDLDETWTLRP